MAPTMVLELLVPTTVLKVQAPMMLEVLATAVQPFSKDELLAPAAVMELLALHMVAEVLARVAMMEKLVWQQWWRFLAQQR